MLLTSNFSCAQSFPVFLSITFIFPVGLLPFWVFKGVCKLKMCLVDLPGHQLFVLFLRLTAPLIGKYAAYL